MTEEISRVTLSNEERERLARPALTAFFNIARLWELGENEQRRVLGSPSLALFESWQSGRSDGTNDETVERISYVLGIYKALHFYFSEPERALRWMRAVNKAELFGGRSANDLIAEGRIADLRAVRRYLDAEIGV